MLQRPLQRRLHLHLPELGDREVQVLDGLTALLGLGKDRRGRAQVPGDTGVPERFGDGRLGMYWRNLKAPLGYRRVGTAVLVVGVEDEDLALTVKDQRPVLLSDRIIRLDEKAFDPALYTLVDQGLCPQLLEPRSGG